ncbi:peptidase family C14 [Beggiatoa sp. PS]|nr:peptidase family C14 [Beggiatoa sp. PS]
MLFLLFTVPTHAARLALIIGNGDYQKVASLDNPVNDAKDMAAVLKNLGFAVTLETDASKRTMTNAVRQFGQQLNNGDVGLFYYSGHGMQFNRRNYLVPPEANIQTGADIEFEGLDASFVLAQMEQANRRGVNLMILDACRDNPYKTNIKSLRKGLAKMQSPVGSLIAYATAPDLASYGDSNTRNSIYTQYLLEALRQKAYLSILDMLTEVTRQVVKRTGSQQIPWQASSLTQRFCFAECGGWRPNIPLQASTPPSLELPPLPDLPAIAHTNFRDRLKDGSLGPEMVWIPAGRFRMGDIQGEGDGYNNNKPVHSVNVKQFAMGKYEVTVSEFRRFVNATGYAAKGEEGCWTYSDGDWGYKEDANWRNPHFSQNNNHPVVCVSWYDATAYVKWLTQQTNKKYRLPTEAEWEYAARAGTETKYWWGNNIGSNKANCYKDRCGDNFEYTAPVGSFAANSFGLFDTVGNVWEWTCSDYEEKYGGKEQDCILSNNHDDYRVLRGGSWYNDLDFLRAADRNGRNYPGSRYYFYGFRVVARTY